MLLGFETGKEGGDLADLRVRDRGHPESGSGLLAQTGKMNRIPGRGGLKPLPGKQKGGGAEPDFDRGQSRGGTLRQTGFAPPGGVAYL